MQFFERRTTVDAPLDRVWAFHSTTDGLEALTPSWLGMQVDRIDRPEMSPEEPPIVPAGSEIHVSSNLFGVFPGQSFVSVIESRSESVEECSFVDTMRGGPLPDWEHTHRFIADGERTRIIDHVEYEAPGGVLGAFIVTIGLNVFFGYRHRRTREILE